MRPSPRSQEQISNIIIKNPAVAGLVSFGGATGFNPSENTARMFIQLKPLGQRLGIQQVIQQLRAPIAKVIGARFYMQVPQDITVGGHLTQAQYQYTLTDTNSDRAQPLGANSAVEDAVAEAF